MKLEEQIREHLETTTAHYPTHEVDIDEVVTRGKRLQWRTRGAVALLSVSAVVAIAVAGFLGGTDTRIDPDAAGLLSDQSLYDQVLEGWRPVPDPVDPELAAVAFGFCEPEPDPLPDGSSYIEPPRLLVIDQRGIFARIGIGGATTEGWAGRTCSAINVDGSWVNADDVTDEIPPMAVGSGGPVPDYVAEIRLRFADGTEVVASIGGGQYLIQYPSTMDARGSIMEKYSAEGALISSEMYQPREGAPELNSYPSQVGSPLPELSLHALIGDAGAALVSPETKVVAVWAPWCAPCRRQLDEVQDIVDQMPGGVVAVGIATEADPTESLETLELLEISFPNARDTADAALQTYGLYGLPATLVVDSNNIIQAVFGGVTEPDQLREAIAQTLP